MKKNVIIPLIIIVTAVILGGGVLFFGGNKAPNEQLAVAGNLKQLELSVPGMFCAGCTASVEGYVSSIPGVKQVDARLAPERSATVIYNPEETSKEEIIKNQIFSVYGVSIVSDEKYGGSEEFVASQSQETIPQEIQEKSQQAVLLLQQRASEGKDVSTSESFLKQVADYLEQGDFANAESLLDTVINILESL